MCYKEEVEKVDVEERSGHPLIGISPRRAAAVGPEVCESAGIVRYHSLYVTSITLYIRSLSSYCHICSLHL